MLFSLPFSPPSHFHTTNPPAELCPSLLSCEPPTTTLPHAAKNELFHVCAEAAETGDVGPSLDDAISMLKEDVLDFDSISNAAGCPLGRRHRALHDTNALYATSRIGGRRVLRKTHPSAGALQRVALSRARHLRFNHFTRPPRRRSLQQACSSELLDHLSIIGGYDGTQIFFKLELDASKGTMSGIRDVVLKPLQLLSESDFFSDKYFLGDGSAAATVFDNIDLDISFSAGAHMGATVGFEVQGDEFIRIPNMTQAQLASRSFILFDDVSAKFTTTARATGDMDIANVGNIAVENATIAFAFGLGMVETGNKIYFNEISSAAIALRKNARWQKVGVMDIAIPVPTKIKFATGIDLTINPIIYITSPHLFTSDTPLIDMDLNLE